MELEELKKEIDSIVRPPEIRRGQHVFNVVDCLFGVARDVMFEDGVDCFYDDTKIDEFLKRALIRINSIPKLSVDEMAEY